MEHIIDVSILKEDNFDVSSILNIKELLKDKLPKKRDNFSNKKLCNIIKKIIQNEYGLANEILAKKGCNETLDKYLNDVNDKIMFDDDVNKVIVILSVFIIMNYIIDLKLVEAHYNLIEL
jgi:hypothetical protein